MSIEATIESAVKEAVKNSITVEKAEEIAFNRFSNKKVGVSVASAILGISQSAVRRLIESKKIKAFRYSEKADWKFNLTDILKYKQL